MNKINYIFFEEFKKLDKLCGDLYKDQFGITHYINDMKSMPTNNSRDIPGWNKDLGELIRLRHIRNHLAHAENAFDEHICTQKDIDWIKSFYQRILNRSDPIAISYQNSAKRDKPAQLLKKNAMSEIPEQNKKNLFLMIGIILALIIIGFELVLFFYM